MDDEILRIRNWERFQHYKDRDPPWIKLHQSLLNNMEWFALSDLAARLLTGLWLLAAQDGNDGQLKNNVENIAWRLRCNKAAVIDGTKELIGMGFLESGTGESDNGPTCPWKTRHITQATRDIISARDIACVKCGANARLEIDHIVPVRFPEVIDDLLDGNAASIENLQRLCKKCNRVKRGEMGDLPDYGVIAKWALSEGCADLRSKCYAEQSKRTAQHSAAYSEAEQRQRQRQGRAEQKCAQDADKRVQDDEDCLPAAANFQSLLKKTGIGEPALSELASALPDTGITLSDVRTKIAEWRGAGKGEGAIVLNLREMIDAEHGREQVRADQEIISDRVKAKDQTKLDVRAAEQAQQESEDAAVSEYIGGLSAKKRDALRLEAMESCQIAHTSKLLAGPGCDLASMKVRHAVMPLIEQYTGATT